MTNPNTKPTPTAPSDKWHAWMMGCTFNAKGKNYCIIGSGECWWYNKEKDVIELTDTVEFIELNKTPVPKFSMVIKEFNEKVNNYKLPTI